MKLFTKLFLCFVLVYGAAFQASGYFLIGHFFDSDVEQEKKYALEQFQYSKFMVQSAIYGEPGLWEEEERMQALLDRLNTAVAIYREDGRTLACNLGREPDSALFEEASQGRVTYQIAGGGREGGSVLVCGQLGDAKENLYLVTETDISAMLLDHRAVTVYFQRLYLAAAGAGFVLILFLSLLLTRPINRVSEAAERIAQGNYGERIRTARKDEIGRLAVDFNRMARTVEEKMDEMSRMVRQKEDFVANFAHEMKTPLTSVIGYADMICHRDLPRQQVKEAAQYIVREGMRLEALAFKLLDLSVMEREDFQLEQMEASEIFEPVKKGMEPVCGERGIVFCCSVQEACIRVEYDLMETLLGNLLDNAVKADSTKIWLEGKREEKGYRITVRDNGRGISPEEIGRVSEAFYMVDKSRSRRQHGAGLGLTLASKIAPIHESRLEIASDGKSGTSVSILLACGQTRESGEGAFK